MSEMANPHHGASARQFDGGLVQESDSSRSVEEINGEIQLVPSAAGVMLDVDIDAYFNDTLPWKEQEADLFQHEMIFSEETLFLLSSSADEVARKSKKITRRRKTTKKKQKWITHVQPADVLFGRGSGPNDHIGNVRFRSLVADRKAEYLATTVRQTKTQIAHEIVHAVWNEGGRFLKRVGGGVDTWRIVDDETTMEKAKQALRQNRTRGVTRPAVGFN